MLGFPICPDTNTNNYTEKGKASSELSCSNIDTSNLLPGEMPQGTYRVFPYNIRDKFFAVDPFTNLYSVKLAKVLGDGEFVTIKEFNLPQVRGIYNGSFAKFIEYCHECGCEYDCECAQLVVDADWLTCPDDLMLLLADMITYESDCSKNIKSESVTGHSWSYGDRHAPETVQSNINIIRRYAGPNGSLARPII